MSQIKLIGLLFVAFTLGSSEAFATPLEDLRQVYLQADDVRWNVKSKAYAKKKAELANYPLLPYFELRQLKRNLSIRNGAQINEFLSRYEHTPLERPLRKSWLEHLYLSKKQKRFMQAYRPNITNKLTCIYHNYQIESGVAIDTILPKITDLWLTKKSQPDECDQLFELWIEKGYQTRDRIWQRIILAQQARQYILVKYLKKQLPTEEKYLLDIWNKARKNPKTIANLAQLVKGNTQESMVLFYTLKRLVWRDELLALQVFDNAVKENRLDATQQQNILDRLVIEAARSEQVQVQQWFNNLDKTLISNSAMQYRLAKELRNQAYPQILEQVNQLPAEKLKDRQWQYWQARTLELTNDNAKANTEFTQLATQRSYYGFLAAARAGKSKVLNHQPIMMSDSEKQRLLLQPSAQRAFELFHLNKFSSARREWLYWHSTLTQEEQLVTAQLAHEQGWYDRGIYSLGKLGELNDMDIRFPTPHQPVFERFSKQYKVDLSWAYAIARKESIFMSDAKSPVGALGLMQLMPSTARQVNNRKIKSWKIIEIDTNVKLGIKYLSYLMKKFDNNIVLATAAYNAGPAKVNKWLKKEPTLAADAWIETIPYKETRNYVKSVLAYTEIYQQKFGQQASPFNQIINMEID